MSYSKNKHQCTMNGLNHWFEYKFEKLGWMALAKEHGNNLKVRAYLQSISHLKECLADKIASVHDLDRKDDLKIMLDHTETLSKAAHKLLDSKLDKCSNKKKHSMDEAQEATFYWLHKWEATMYERLGWMVLSKNEGNSLKIKSYFHSIHLLKDSLYKKINDVQEKDRKDDLKILYDDACILWRAACKILGKPESMDSGMGSMSMKSGMDSVHSDEAPHGMVVRMNSKGHKHLSRQSSSKAKRHNKHRHTRYDRDASKKQKKTKKYKKSKSILSGLF